MIPKGDTTHFECKYRSYVQLVKVVGLKVVKLPQ